MLGDVYPLQNLIQVLWLLWDSNRLLFLDYVALYVVSSIASYNHAESAQLYYFLYKSSYCSVQWISNNTAISCTSTGVILGMHQNNSLKGGWSALESGVKKMHIGIVNYL